jgi:hypothetical protein
MCHTFGTLYNIYTSRLTVWLTHRRFEQNNKTENHFFCQMVAADRAEGGQVDPVLGMERLFLFST